MLLAILTIVFNIAEGVVSIWFGVSDDMLTLFGFGLDSFIETVSAIGVAVMITRIRNNPETDKTRFEITALKITGWCFYILAVILAVGSVFNLVQGHKPESTIAGVVISLISIASMLGLIIAQKDTWDGVELPPAYCRRQLQFGLRIHVRGFADRQRGFCIVSLWLDRYGRNRGDHSFLGKRRKRIDGESECFKIGLNIRH